ncbi:MAG: hypothetical protein GTO40_11435, partial [Deltaproteobacteria bacterium]|nr:hypothetical protein [Deltaproteobacteria bacterium]
MMMASHKITPEERLLRLIESDGKSDGGETPTEARPTGKSGGWLKIFSRNSNASFRRADWLQHLRPELSLRLVNRILIGVLVLVVIGIAFELNNSRTLPEDLKNPVKAIGPSAGNQGNGDVKLASVGPLPEYLEPVNKRDIFAPAPIVKVKPPKPELKRPTRVSAPKPDP